MSGRISAFVALAAVVFAVHAPISSAAAATAAASCGRKTAISHRNSGFRSLSSAKFNQVKNLCGRAQTSANKLNFWYSKPHKWTLYLNQTDKKCWQVHLAGPERLCLLARALVRLHTRRLASVNRRIKALTPPVLNLGDVAAWSCIHSGWKGSIRVGSGEGSWTANTGKYYGGLQMDDSFMSVYGPPVLGYTSAAAMFAARGTADKWTPQEQIAVAEYARSHGRGYGPWPNTAKDCGLL